MLQRVKLSYFACLAWALLTVLSGCSSTSGTLVRTDGGPDAKSDASDGGADSAAPPDSGGTDSTIGADTSASDTGQDTSSSDTSAPDTSVPDTSMDAPADTTPVTDSGTADTSPTDSQAPTFTVGGTITGTGGQGVTLQDNGADNITVSMDGAFTFPTPLATGAAFNVTVLSTAGGLSCAVTGGSGTIAGGNVSTVSITCSPSVVDSGPMDTGPADTGTADTGTVDTGTADTGAADTGTVDTGTVDTGVVDTGTPDTGTADTGAVDSGTVDSGGPTTTVGGTIMGLAPGDSVEVELNGADGTFLGSNGAFVFSMPLPSGAMYAVTVKSNPATPTAQNCTVGSGTGTVGSTPVNSVAITCVTAKFTISGNVTLVGTGSDSITLRDNGMDDVIIPSGTQSPARFTFPTPILSGSTYTVTAFATGGTAVTCTAEPVGTMFQGVVATTPAMGTVTDQNVTGILIECN
jgi:hypothetical protein